MNNIQKIKEEVSSEFIKVNDLLDAIETAIVNNLNLLIYGEPGVGKSSVVFSFLDKLVGPNNYYKKAVGSRTQPEHLFGGFSDVKNAMNETYDLENSFMSKEYVVFEEFFDMPIKLLLDLKDPLSRGVFINGHYEYKIKCKSIIAITNKTPKELSSNDTIKALMERFHLKINVVNNFKTNDYLDLFSLVEKKRFNNKFNPSVSYIGMAMLLNINKVSPRIAELAYILHRNNLSSRLKFIEELPSDFYNDLTSLEEKLKLLDTKVIDKINKFEEKVKNITSKLKLAIAKRRDASLDELADTVKDVFNSFNITSIADLNNELNNYLSVIDLEINNNCSMSIINVLSSIYTNISNKTINIREDLQKLEDFINVSTKPQAIKLIEE